MLAAAVERPNVNLILADELGYGDLGAHGNPRLRTPNLDRLCQQSVRSPIITSRPGARPAGASC